MLKVTPKLGLGKWQAKPKCLTNRQQIELHTAYSESTLCNLNWALCLHLPHTHIHKVKFTVCIVCASDTSMYAYYMSISVWVNVGPHLDKEWIEWINSVSSWQTEIKQGCRFNSEIGQGYKAMNTSTVTNDWESLNSCILFSMQSFTRSVTYHRPLWTE